MPTKDVDEDKDIPTLAEMLYYHYPADGIAFTSESLRKIMDSLSTFYPKSSNEEKTKMTQIIKLEIIMKFCHYAENLGAVAIAFNKKFDSSDKEILGLFEKIYKYQIKDVEKFYKKIPRSDLNYVRKFLGFPPLRLQNEIARRKITEACEIAKKQLEIISKNYLEFKDLYNSYKHGYRVFPAKDQNQQDAYVYVNLGKQKITTADDKTFEEITKATKSIEQNFKLILNFAARTKMEKKGGRNTSINLKFFVKKKGLPHDPNTLLMWPARGKNRRKNIADRERIYHKFRQELESKDLGKLVLFNLDSEEILGIAETLDEVVKLMHSSTSKGRKGIRQIGSDAKTEIDWE